MIENTVDSGDAGGTRSSLNTAIRYLPAGSCSLLVDSVAATSDVSQQFLEEWLINSAVTDEDPRHAHLSRMNMLVNTVS